MTMHGDATNVLGATFFDCSPEQMQGNFTKKFSYCANLLIATVWPSATS